MFIINSNINNNNNPNSISFNNNNNTIDLSLSLFPKLNNNYSRVATDTDSIEYSNKGDKEE